MITRRTLLHATALAPLATAVPFVVGTEAAAGATPALPGLRWLPGRLLPRFAAPVALEHADLRDTGSVDRLLLTTLQGVVNRGRPRIYLTFDPVDTTWLHDSGVPSTTVADPLELLDRHRGAVRGAVVYDPEVPDTVNVATTLAGLEDCVVAHPDQVAAHGLPVVADLRGRFGDDPLATYRWQLEHLFPRCTRRLLVGLPPTTTEANPGVEWREVARETREIRDSSNRGRYTFDLSPELADGAGEAYLRFQDSFTSDGWGASIRGVVVRSGGTVVATFEPGTPEEEPYLFDGSRSQIGGEGNRFADGTNFFVYRFRAPAGATRLEVEVEMWNQYLVTASSTPPTRELPFPYFRDYAVATRAMVTWLPPAGAYGELLSEILSQVEPTTPYAGWFSDDVQGEWSGVDLASRQGVEVLPADFYMNGTVHGGVRAPVSAAVPPVPRVRRRPKVYLTLTIGEGDNVQYCQRRMRDLWEDPRRGEVPVNWTISPLLADIGPALLAYYQRTRTANDLLVAGPSGAGYTYPGSWPAPEVGRYFEVTGRYLRRTGMDLVYAYNQRSGDGWVPFSEEVVEGYAEHTPIRGIVQSWERGDLLFEHAGIPVIGNLYPVGGPQVYHERLLEHTAEWDGSQGPAFVAGAVNAWSWTPSDVARLAELLDDRFELVRGDTFFTLLAEEM